MAEAIIYPGVNDRDVESLKETLEKRKIEYSISSTETSGRYRSMVNIGGKLYHNSPTLLRHLDALQNRN